MNFELIFGSITFVSSLVMASVGLPSQIWKNYRTKTSGIALMLIILTLAVYLPRTVYTAIRQDYYILIPDLVGLVCSIVILIQHFLYKKH